MRRRYRYDEVMRAMVEVGIVDTPAPKVHIITDAAYSDLRLPWQGGPDISTRKRHRQYMKDNDLALYEDYEQTFAKQQEAKEREAMGVGPRDETLREDLKDAYEMTRAGYKPPPRPEVEEKDAAIVTSYIVGKDL